MGRKNVNVVVGGPVQSDYPKVYNTVFIKPNIPFALQVTEPNTKYVIRHKIDLGGKGDTVSDVDFTNADTHETGGVEYYYVPFTANGKPYTLLDDSCVFITSDWTGLSARTITPEAGTLFMIGSVEGGLHTDAYINGEVITMPENTILEFDGGSLDNGVIIGQDTVFINVGDVEIWGNNLVKLGTWKEHSGGGDKQIQSDWEQTDDTQKDYIKNKPVGLISDKEYDPENYSGLGRKTLELGDDGSNILTQGDFDQSNTIYVVGYDFDLNGETVEIPEGSVLRFDSGSISNCTIRGNNTKIDAGIANIFGDNLVLEGTFAVEFVHPEWFGAKGDGVADDTAAFIRALSTINSTLNYIVATGKYLLTDTINVAYGYTLDGRNSGELIFDISEETKYCVELARKTATSVCRLINFKLSNRQNLKGYGIVCHRLAYIENCDVKGFNYGIAIRSYSTAVLNCNSTYNYVNIGIASAILTLTEEERTYEQTNDVVVQGGTYMYSYSGENVKIGDTPWAAPAGTLYYGHLITINRINLDQGCIAINKITNVIITGCYIEHNDWKDYQDAPQGVESKHYGIGIYIGSTVSGVSIKDNWFHVFNYGVYVTNGPDGIWIKNNMFGTIRKTLVYFENTPGTMQCTQNYGSITGNEGYTMYHFGLMNRNTYQANIILKAIKNNNPGLRSMSLLDDYAYSTTQNKLILNRNNYLTGIATVTINGYFINEVVSAEPLKVNHYFVPNDNLSVEWIPGLIIDGYDCYISKIDIDDHTNPRILIYSPTNDYPFTDTTVVADGYTTSQEGTIVSSGKFNSNYETVLTSELPLAIIAFTKDDLPVYDSEHPNQPPYVIFPATTINLSGEDYVVPVNTTIDFSLGGGFTNGTIYLNYNELINIGVWSRCFSDTITLGEYDGQVRYRRGQQMFDNESGIYKPKWYNGFKFTDAIGRTVAATWGYTSGRPSNLSASSDVGYAFFDATLRYTIYFDGSTWVDGRGFTATSHKGTTRPLGVGAAGGVLNALRDIGFEFFDTNPGVMKPVYVSAIANDGTVTWVDANGETA